MKRTIELSPSEVTRFYRSETARKAIKRAREFNTPLITAQVLNYPEIGPLSRPLVDLERSALAKLSAQDEFQFDKKFVLGVISSILILLSGGFTEDENSLHFLPNRERRAAMPTRESFFSLSPGDTLVLSALNKAHYL